MKKQDDWLYFVVVFIIGMAAGSLAFAGSTPPSSTSYQAAEGR